MPYPGTTVYPDVALLPGSLPVTATPTGFSDGVLEDVQAAFILRPDAYTGDLANFMRLIATQGDLLYSIVASQGYPGDVDYVAGWSRLLDPDTCPTQFLPYLAQFNGTQIPPGTDDKTARQIIRAEAAMQRGTVAAIMTAALRYLVGTTNLVGTLQQLDTTTKVLPTSEIITTLPVAPLSQLVMPQTLTVTDPTGTYQQSYLMLTPGNPGDTSLQIYPEQPNYAYPVGSSVEGAFLFLRERWNGSASVADPYHVTVGYRPDEVTDSAALQAAVNAVKPAGIIVDYLETDGFTWAEAVNTWDEETMTWNDTISVQP